ncbi:T28 [Tupaiid betaherpesvirus 1]|uniref:T28 n=1 Tax=Tupaiid herpesvirus 1 (strain 1) TaxID=10397 RepID=Q91TS0_TUHV1|nr:T28 [Tupaiid betaherpesvirus 1]AAK57067.1 T28 [Tupaiid betaherpesvirus 1]
MAVSALELINACPRAPEDGRAPALRELVSQYPGTRVDLGWPANEVLIVGEPEYFEIDFDVRRLTAFPCVQRKFELVVVGLVRLQAPRRTAEPLELIVVSSSGGRVYAYSRRSDLLYIVSEEGFDDLINQHRGLRWVFEIYDLPSAGLDDELARFNFECSPVVARLMTGECTAAQVADFLSSHPRFTCETFWEPEGYFMFGDEQQLNLGQYLPTRVFQCLRAAGYRVLGQGYRLTVVLFNERCETFALLRNGFVVKVANTIRGFLRDRLQLGLAPKRYVFRSELEDLGEDEERELCIGNLKPFACDVKYVLQDDEWLYKRVRSVRVAWCARPEPKEIELLLT